MVLNEVGHARPPVVELVGLGELGSSAVPEPALSENRSEHMHGTEVNLDPLLGANVTADGRGRAPCTAVSISIQPKNGMQNRVQNGFYLKMESWLTRRV